MQETLTHELHDESRQGEAISMPETQGRAYQKHFYIESYGCAMNFADSEVVASILNEQHFGCTNDISIADVVLINTCSIREKAEERIRHRLMHLKQYKRKKPGLLIGIMGCMAERLKTDLLEEEKLVDMVVGPDAYRTLPRLIEEAETGQRSINVLLSREETYADISPIRLNSNGINAFVSIMRGCNNMCSFCVVPFTRGRERSRPAHSILTECTDLFNQGYREVTLLGQNVDSYYWHDETKQHRVTFAELLEMIALISPLLRIRFSTSHPKDITDEVLFTMKKYNNICNYIHLPVQSGSSRMLQMMNRTYSREWYLAKVDRIREILPDCGLSTDMIAGFCSETEEDHQDSISLMEYCHFDLAYLYYYSERPGTLAARRMPDDVPLEVKKRRLQDLVDLHRIQSLESMKKDVGKTFRVLIEGDSKKNPNEYYGRNDHNKVVVFPKGKEKPGMYVDVLIDDCTAGTLIGKSVSI
jgi:tRNA-2-methylthio-N6-dimethylallyladenosine synthase